MGRLPLNERPPAPSAGPVEPLAVIAMGWSLLACCPAAALLGTACGLIALGRIRGADGPRQGRGLAKASIAVSVVVGLASVLVGGRYSAASEAQMLSDVRVAVTQLIDSDLDPTAWWSGATAEGLIDYRRKIRAELGRARVEGITLVATEIGLPTTARFRLLLESESAQRVASVEAEVGADPATWMPRVRLRTMSIAGGESEGQGAPALEFPVRTLSEDGSPDAPPATLGGDGSPGTSAAP